ncbi:hypothetical protein [Pedobacter sp. UBA4863]|uniref:hypothetical protein n=1 Tax=Pedobacter sp. UBA4863 TaxID=1947060 RepID=UPI0025DEBC16|nr:hypothetical protein [Pedobacter sp. UBA4863]
MRLIIIFLTVCLFSCKKSSKNHIIEPRKESFKVQVLGFSATNTTGVGMATLWTDNERPVTDFIPNNHHKITLYGLHQIISLGYRNLTYFGTELINDYSRIVLFTYEGKKVLSNELSIALAANRHEYLHSFSKDAEGNLYVYAYTETVTYKKVSYIYKISTMLEISKIDMPLEPSFACLFTKAGLVSLHAEHVTNAINLTVSHQRGTRWFANLSLNGYKQYVISDAYSDFEGKVLIMITAVNSTTNKQEKFVFALNIDKNTVMRHKLLLDDRSYSFGKGMVEGNVLYLPGVERNTNKAFYLRIDTQTSLEEIPVSRINLEVDARFPVAQASFLQRLNGEIFVGGTQFGKACYWRSSKLVMLPAINGIMQSHPIEINLY